MEINSFGISRLFILIVFITTTLIGCGETDSAINVVKSSITEVSTSGRNYQTGPLVGGNAVLVDDMAAYWVYDGTVYAANGHAKAWSPSVRYATSGKVTYASVKGAVQ